MKRELSINIVLTALIFFISGCSSQIKKQLPNDFQEYPSEWMYNQRAYPDNIINREAIKDAFQITKKANESNRMRSTGSWEIEGPLNIGGRVTSVAISPASDDILFIGTAVGGVFRSLDQGLNWQPIFDNIGLPSIGALAIAPSNGNRIYVGTGEANGSAASGAFFGDGIYRSDDNGDSWTSIGLENAQHVGRIAIDPSNADRVFVATSGILYGSNPDRGLYRTTDGGANWEQVLYLTDSTACIDVVINPENPNILYAATWERIRYPWQRDYGGVTSGVHRSMDGGDTWELLTNGLPLSDTETGRIGLAISEQDPSIVFASYTTNSITNIFDGLYRSNDNGDNWQAIDNGFLNSVNSSFGWYFGNVRCNPTDSNEVHVLGQSLYKTNDGGTNWSGVFGMHVDYHAMEYSHNNPNLILVGSDGGAYLSEDGGINWMHFENLPITQFYNIAVDYLEPDRLYGGTQDNNTLRTLTGELNDYQSILGGDGFHVNVDPIDNNFIYAEYQWGGLSRSTDGGFNFQNATNGIDPNDRTNWNTPVRLSPFDPTTLYYGSNILYQSDDHAASWYPISEDLTGGLHPSGSLGYGTLTAIAGSYNNLDVIYSGSDDGKVNVTFNGGTNWQSIDNDLPNQYVTQIAIHPENDLTAYVTFSGFKLLEYAPRIFKTNDGGQNWVDISANLPDIPINDILISSTNFNLFIGTDMGAWYSEDDGLSWNILGDNLPITIVQHLAIHEPTNMLYAGTFGRSIFSFDLTNLISIGIGETVTTKPEIFVYPNPARDEIILRLNLETTSEVKILITDAQGRIVKELYRGILTGKGIEKTFDVSSLSPGTYTVHIIGEDKKLTRQVVIL